MLHLCLSLKSLLVLTLSVVLITVSGCKTANQQSSQTNTPIASQTDAPQTDSAVNIDPSILDRLKNERWTGDIDGMLERRSIRKRSVRKEAQSLLA